jgi:hypothetical protein
MEPCGTSVISLGVDISPSTENINFLWESKELMRWLDSKIFNSGNSYSKPSYHVAPKAFPISKNTAAVAMLLLKFKVTWSLCLIHWRIIVVWRAKKTNWLALSRNLSSMRLGTVFRITLSNSLPDVDKGLIGHKFWGNFESYRISVTL